MCSSECDNCEIKKASGQIVYQIHITVPPSTDKEHFISVCEKYGIKPVIVENYVDSGKQLDMLTSSPFFGESLEDAREEMQSLVDALVFDGLEIIRTKIETVPWNPIVPSVDNKILFLWGYFETHLTVNDPTSEEARSILDIARLFNAKLSRNVNSKKLYITYRENKIRKEPFLKKVEALKQKVLDSGLYLDKMVTEFIVVDSDINHDKEWMTSKY